MSCLFAIPLLLLSKITSAVAASALMTATVLREISIWLMMRDPAADFLTDAVAVEAALLGLSIPLSFDIIARISERYESDVVTHLFVRERVVVWMPRCLVFNIALAIAMKFLKGAGGHGSLKWRVLAWFSLAGFVLIAGVLFAFLDTLKKYIVNRDYVIGRLLDEARNAIR